MSMTEHEAIRELHNIRPRGAIIPQKRAEALDVAIKALEEIQAYRAIGTVEEFKAYKDAEEQGLLLRLPCPIGGTLYQCNFINRQKIEREYKVIGLVFDIARNVWLYEIVYQVGVEWRKTVCSFDAIGLTVFLTREEAEQALEENKKDCTKCFWYWKNNDTENECKGEEKPCHEFILAEKALETMKGGAT